MLKAYSNLGFPHVAKILHMVISFENNLSNISSYSYSLFESSTKKFIPLSEINNKTRDNNASSENSNSNFSSTSCTTFYTRGINFIALSLCLPIISGA